MQTRLIDEPGFAAQTSAFLERIGKAPGLTDYQALLAARARTADPAVAGRPDPAAASADLYLPARGGPVLARLYARTGARDLRPVLLWLHGGGFVGGSVNDIEHVCTRLAHLADLIVVSLEYRLAPEHPFPAALHDTYDAMAWLAAHGHLIGGDGRLRPAARARARRWWPVPA